MNFQELKFCSSGISVEFHSINGESMKHKLFFILCAQHSEEFVCSFLCFNSYPISSHPQARRACIYGFLKD